MVIITSKQNTKIKELKRLHRRRYRDQSGLFIAEGLRLIEDMLQTDDVVELYYAEQFMGNHRGMELISLAERRSIPVYRCSDQIFSDLCATENDQGILAVARQPEPVQNWEHHFKKGVILIVDQVQDPGNLGTILRTALATGIDGIWLVKGTVDPFNPKVVRSSMGAILRMPFSSYTPEQCLAQCEKFNLKLIVTDVTGGEILFQTDFRLPLALVIGNEANGVQEHFTSAADAKVYIPLENAVESLNVSVASGVLLYEIIRQQGVR